MPKAILSIMLFLVLPAAARSQEIFDAIKKGDIQTIRKLVEGSPQVLDARNSDNMTPLHCAASGGNADLIGYLLDKGAKLELKDVREKTPLHLAAMSDRKEAVAVLLARGAAVESRDDYQRTALILCARERGRAATARVLLNAGADVNAADTFGSTAIDLAAWRGKTELVDLLLEKGAAVPGSGEEWQMMLSRAASNGLTNLFRRLTGGNQDLKAVSGGSLLHAAAQGGSAEIVGTINSAGSETTPFISPDGSYLLYSRQYDLWVSRRGTDSAWSEPVKLGAEVNSPEMELCPIVTADGRYLFFLSTRGGESHPYWISATVIDNPTPVESAGGALESLIAVRGLEAARATCMSASADRTAHGATP